MTASPKSSPRLQAVIWALPLRPDSRVLEIGCGPGTAARAVAARLTTGHILAIDRSSAAIAQAKAAAHEEIASGHMDVRHVAAEDFVVQPDEAPTTSSSPSASAPSTVATRTPASGRSSGSRARRPRTLGSSSTAATRSASCASRSTRRPVRWPASRSAIAICVSASVSKIASEGCQSQLARLGAAEWGEAINLSSERVRRRRR